MRNGWSSRASIAAAVAALLVAVAAFVVARHLAVGSAATLVVILGDNLIVFAVVVVLARRGVRQQVEPLQRTVEDVIRGRGGKVRSDGEDRGELERLGVLLGAMVEVLAATADDLEGVYREREEQLKAQAVRQQLGDRALRQRAQAIVDATIARVLDEMRAVLEESDQLRGAAAVIEQAADSAAHVTQAMATTAAGADRLVAAMTESLHRVDDVATFIGGVTERTTLLALNATIEAARAGAAGRGFGVVAAEVKSLADETRRSTDTITGTVSALGADATAMASTLTAMASGVSNAEMANSQVSQVATDQRDRVERLDRSVHEAIARIEEMSALTARLERRRDERVPLDGLVRLRRHGRETPASLLDLSIRGMLCGGEMEWPLHLGDVVEVDLHLDAERLSLAARVVRYDGPPADGRYGMEFTDVGPEVVQRIDSYLRGILEHQRSGEVPAYS